jgi:transketolase
MAVEAGISMGWDRWVGPHGAILALDRFGASGPGNVVFENLGFSAANVLDMARKLLAG